MSVPAPVSGQTFGTEVGSEERSNYLRGGIMFTGAYNDNVFAGLNGRPIGDDGYTIMPTMNWDEMTSRLHWQLSYAPGFTVYQHESSLNQTDQNATLNFQYRLSPHVTMTAQDRFQKTSNIFNQPDPTASTVVSGGIGAPNFSIITPLADQLMNSGNVGINYQFGLNRMIGASGTFSTLHFPNENEVQGLYDSESQGGSIFLSLRASEKHYFGTTYQYQRLLSYPFGTSAETRTQTISFFYSFRLNKRFSLSAFGGPQYSDSAPTAFPDEIPTPEIRAWTPAMGGSLSWQGQLNSFALSYSHIISGGGGLEGAVHMDGAAAFFRQRLSKTLGVSLSGSYANNKLLAGALSTFVTNGHTIQGTVSLQQQVGQNLALGLGYTRMRQDYSDVPALGANPNTNREFVSLSYQFSRPLGR